MTAMEANGLAEAPLIVAASHDQKMKYLGRMCEEPLQASLSLLTNPLPPNPLPPEPCAHHVHAIGHATGTPCARHVHASAGGLLCH